MPRLLRTAGAVALALALLVLVPSLASAAPRWLAPIELTPPGAAVFPPRIVVDAAGNAVAAWTEQRGTGRVVRAASRPAGSTTWGTPADVSPGPVLGLADLAVDPAGNVIALWGAPSPEAGPSTSTVQVAIRPSGAAAFGAPVDVSAPGAVSIGLALAVDPQGGLIVVWSQAGPANGAPATVMTRSRPAGATEWSAPDVLSTPGEHAVFADVAAGPGGRAVVVWSSVTGSGPRTVRARFRDGAAGPWTLERIISAPDTVAAEPRVAMGPAGEVLATWPSGESPAMQVLFAVRPGGGDWTAPAELGPTAVSPLVGVRPVIEPDGTATVVWLNRLGGRIVARTRPAGGSFGAEQALSDPDVRVDPFPIDLTAAGPGGGVIVVWARNSLGTPTVIQAAIKPAGALAFGPTADVSARGRSGTSPAAALAPAGEAVAAWVDAPSLPSSTGAIQVADYTERPGPVLAEPPAVARGIEAPERAVAGAIVRVRVDFTGSVDRVPVRVQRRGSGGAFTDVGDVVRVTGSSATLPVRLAPGRAVLRVAYEDRGAPAATGTATVIVSRPRSPLVPVSASRVIVGTGAVWLLTSENGEARVVRLNQRTGRVQGAPIPVPGAVSMAVGGGAVWLVRGEGHARGLLRLDPVSGAVTEIAFVPGGGIAAGPAGVWAIECERVPGLRPTCGKRNVVRLDPATNGIAQRVLAVDGQSNPERHVGITAVGTRSVWLAFAEYDTSSTARLDPASGAIGPSVGVGGSVSASGDLLWGVTFRRCELSRVRLGGKAVQLGRMPGAAGRRCRGLVAGSESLWVVQESASSSSDTIGPPAPARLVRLDARTRRAIGRPIPLGLPTVTLDVGAGAIWAASSEEGVVRRIDPRPAARAGAGEGSRRPPRLAAGAWSRALAISGPAGRSASQLRLVVGPDGRAVTLWRRSSRRYFSDSRPHELVSAVRPSGRARWGLPRRLAALRGGIPLGDRPGLTMSATGEGLAAWWQRDPADAGRIVASRLVPRASEWDAPVPVPGPEGAQGWAEPRIAADGSALIGWKCRCGTGFTAVVARRPAGGAFEPGVAIPNASTMLDALALAANRRGEAVAVTTAVFAGLTQAASAPAGGPFGESTAIAAPPTGLSATAGRSPDVALNDAGSAVAVWEQADGIEAARRAPDGTWSAPVRIARVTSAPVVTLDARGNALVAFTALDSVTGNRRLYAVTGRAGGTWSQPVAVSPPGSAYFLGSLPALAATPRGEAVLAWSQRVAGRERVLARRRAADGRWGAVEAVSPAQRKIRDVRVAIDTRGVATTAWIAEVGIAPRVRDVVRIAIRPSG